MKAQAVLVLEGREEGGRPSLCVSLLAPLALAKICPKTEEPGVSRGMPPSAREEAVCALPSLGCIFSRFLELSWLTKKPCLNQCWLSSACPAAAAQRPRWRSLQETGASSVGTSLHQFRAFSQGGRACFSLVFKGPPIYTLCLAFPPCPLLLIPHLAQPGVLTAYKVYIPKRGKKKKKLLKKTKKTSCSPDH